MALAGQRCQAAVETAVEIINNKYPKIKVPLADQEGHGSDGLQDRARARRQPGQARRGQGRGRAPDQPGGRLRHHRLLQQLGQQAGQHRGRARQEDLHVRRLQLRGPDPAQDMKYFFRMAPTDEIESMEFVDVLKWLNKTQKNANIKTIGVIYENTEFGKHAAEEAKKAAAAGRLPGRGRRALHPRRHQPRQRGADRSSPRTPTRSSAPCLGADYSLMVRTMKKMNWIPKMTPQLLHRATRTRSSPSSSGTDAGLLHGLHGLLARVRRA
ncbi:MAG: hypothetical protein MZV64_09580 [Ignavibacteriales bacterium]|nr:hypothetical protein [Ignavibacteriales bacterium]